VPTIYRWTTSKLNWLPGALLLAWALVAACPPAHAQRADIVKRISISHVGPPAVSDSLIRANIRVRVGEPYRRDAADDDAANLYKTGYFDNIRVSEEAVEGGVHLIYVVKGKSTITQILFAGNSQYSASRLLKKVTSKVGEPKDERKLYSDAQAIQKFYQEKGYQQTKVSARVADDEQLGRATVTFEVEEAPRVRIADINFVGAEAFSQRRLRGVLKTKRHWMFSWLTRNDILKDDVFELDLERLNEFYRQAGYIDFETKVEKVPLSPKRIELRFDVREGVRYRIGAVTLEGNKLFNTSEILANVIVREGPRTTKGLTMGVGEVFTPRGLSRDRQAIEDYYGARGYIDAAVTPVRLPNTARGTMDLVYRIDEGEKSRIEKIEIRGNDKTKDRVLRRELAVYPGMVFDMVRVKLSTNRLAQLDYFEKVDAQPEPTEVRNHKNLVIAVEEKGTGHMQVGAGFSSLESLFGYFEVGQGNADLFKWPIFFGQGAGQKLRLRVQYGLRSRIFQVSFVEPWFLNRKLAFGVDLYHDERNYYSDIYDRTQTGIRLSLTRALWNDFWVGSMSYSIENNGIINVDPSAPQAIKDERGYRLVSKVGASLAYDTRNSVNLPNKGQRTELRSEIAGGPLGGDSDFYRLDLRSTRYIRGFGSGHVLELTGRLGFIDTYDDATRVPLFERWFLGGPYTLRGYKFARVGPRDISGAESLGGNTYWLGSIEYSIPIIERLRFAAFYDIGNVFPDAYSFSVRDSNYASYNDDWGVGIRFNIPGMGPLRLDYAFPISHDKFVGSGGRFSFSFGWTRDY
jgi:outer membrane protein insertion porin family